MCNMLDKLRRLHCAVRGELGAIVGGLGGGMLGGIWWNSGTKNHNLIINECKTRDLQIISNEFRFHRIHLFMVVAVVVA